MDKAGFKILIVEDNDGDYLLVEGYLLEKIQNPELLRAESFRQAREILQEFNTSIDTVLLDLSLADNQGEQLINDMIAISEGIPIIILTGFTNFNFAVKSLSLGATDYLLKDELNPTLLYKSIVYGIERNNSKIQLKNSEQRYSDLFHLSPLPMWVFDKETLEFLDVNEAACEHYGYSTDEFLNMTIKDIRPKEEVKLLEDTIAGKDPNPPYTGTFRHQKKSGEVIHVEIKSKNLIYEKRNARLVQANDITEMKNAQEELLNITYQVEDKERTRISVNIHDGLQQTLLASFMHFETLKKPVGSQLDDHYSERFLKGLSILKDGIEQARSLAHELMPANIEEEGYVEAVSDLINQNTGTGTLNITFEENLNGRRLAPNTELILFRITQESINNIIKHAHATEATIVMNLKEGEITLKVADNGVGFEVNSNDETHSKFGLKAIATRVKSLGGNFELISKPTQGTTLKVAIPLVEHLPQKRV